VVPGITAAAGCSAYAGIPLTHRGLATGVRYVTGHLRDNNELDHDWSRLVDGDTTLVCYMGLVTLPEIVRGLLDAGMDPATPAAVVQNGTTPRQRHVMATVATLADRVAEAKLRSPAIIIIGKVVSLADTLHWFVPAESETAEIRRLG
jgi:uroporphyrin-III C-methyltransferase